MAYVSDVIKYEQDIEPYRVIQIYAGVGAGKNAWVAKLVESGKRVLLVTSRKATADAQANKLEGCRWINLDEIQKPEENNAVVVTNAGIEKYIKHKYNKDDEKTHLWKYFDIVVIDEAHSLAVDATFSDAPFYIMTFVTQVLNKSTCKIILMSGTPEPLERMLKESFKKSTEYNCLDLYNKCEHAYPKEVILTGNRGLIRQKMYDAMENGSRMVYFANTVDGILKVLNEVKSYGLSEESIGVSFSNPQKKSKFSKEMLQKMEIIDKSLRENERIPDDIRLFITTSKNKEGINILNTDIGYVVSEAIDKSSLVQMAGRIRHGLYRLIVLYDVEQNATEDLLGYEVELHNSCWDVVNNVACKYISNGIDAQKIIARTEKHFPYIRYDYFSGKFGKYIGKFHAVKQIDDERNQFQRDVNRVIHYGKKPRETQLWFPDSHITVNPVWGEDAQRESFKEKAISHMKEHGYFDGIISREKKEKLLPAIIEIAKNYEMDRIDISPQAKNLNTVLKRIGYKMEEIGRHDGSRFVLRKLENKE